MPPRVVKRGAAASSSKRGGRASRGAGKTQTQPPEDVSRKIDDGTIVDVKPAVQEENQVVAEKPVVEAREPDDESKSDVKSLSSSKNGEELKDSVEDYEKDERLELDDNEPEYEPEEYGGEEYDDKELEQDDVQEEEEGDGGDEELEEGNEEEVEEEEADLVEEELEEVPEEVEVEEEDEQTSNDHAEMADATEEVEHHDVFKERRKRKAFEVFVGGLDKDATEADLRKAFGRVGEVTEVRLMKNSQTKKNKGYAFLRFATVEQATRAITELKNTVINGKQCGVSPSQDSDTLFLGNICKTWTKEALKEKLKHYGVDNVEDVTLVEDSNSEGMNRGFAFIEFSCRTEAMDAFKRLQRREILFGVDRPAKVSLADAFIDPGDEIMAQVKTIFIDGLPSSWDEDHVRELLKMYGKIEKVELARNMPSASRKDFGFVTFDSHEAAIACAKSINNEDLGEGENKAKVRARLSRPLQRGKGKNFSRRDVRPGRGTGRVSRGTWPRSIARSLPSRTIRTTGSRVPPASVKRPVRLRERHAPAMSPRTRSRPLSPPPRSYDRRAPVAAYPKSSLKREYSRRDELPPLRSRAPIDYGPRAVPERRQSYRDEYSSRGAAYPDIPRGNSRGSSRRDYVDDAYPQRFERPDPSYREGRPRDYDSFSGSKRPYAMMDDIPPRYVESSVRHSRARVDYELPPRSSHYGDGYGDSRLGRSNLGYGSSRNTMSSQDSHGMYAERHGMDYGGLFLLLELNFNELLCASPLHLSEYPPCQQVHTGAMMVVECTLRVMAVITHHEAVMLGVVLTHQCTRVAAWVAAVTWVQAVQDHTTNIK
ncbi:Heterogeneous nuclear ribonucleoprotein Q [Linum grandiflorum]